MKGPIVSIDVSKGKSDYQAFKNLNVKYTGSRSIKHTKEGFDVKVKQGDFVKQGDVLVNVDLDKIHQLGKSTLTMVLFTEGNKVKNNNLNKEVQVNEQIDITF